MKYYMKLVLELLNQSANIGIVKLDDTARKNMNVLLELITVVYKGISPPHPLLRFLLLVHQKSFFDNLSDVDTLNLPCNAMASLTDKPLFSIIRFVAGSKSLITSVLSSNSNCLCKFSKSNFPLILSNSVELLV